MAIQGPSDLIEGLGPQPHQANFALNQEKLKENLLDDASSDLPSIECTVKDSDKYVYVECSPAFFFAVVSPAMCALHPPYNAVPDIRLYINAFD